MDIQDVQSVTAVIIKFNNKELQIKNFKINLMNFMRQQIYQISEKVKE
jgi:NACalpha-BTF3-like transcription factor